MRPIDKTAQVLARVVCKQSLPRAVAAGVIAQQAQRMGLRPRDLTGRQGRDALEAIAAAVLISPIAFKGPARPRLDAEWHWTVMRAAYFYSKAEKQRSWERKGVVAT